MYYKYDMHCHDKLCSACAHNSPEEMVAAYEKAGYSGMVFTNHFLKGNTAVDKTLPWKEKIQAYKDAYLRALAAVTKPDFYVFFGIEHWYERGKEMLTYGITPEFLMEHEDIEKLPIEEYARLVREAGGYLSHAHPFRHNGSIDADYMPSPDCMDAVESFNFFNTDEENERAHEYALQNGLYETSGADVHDDDCVSIGQAGMAFPYEIKSSEELVAALKKRDGKRIIKGEIVG